MRAARGGVPRDPHHRRPGRGGLLAEVFSNEGIGTLIHANEYQAIRRAQRRTPGPSIQLIQDGVENDELMRRTRAEIERQIEDYFVFEVDRNPVGLRRPASVPREPAGGAGLRVRRGSLREPGHRRQADAVRRDGRPRLGAEQLFCLSTQAFNYFLQKGGFRAGNAGRLAAGPARTLRSQRPAVASPCQIAVYADSRRSLIGRAEGAQRADYRS